MFPRSEGDGRRFEEFIDEMIGLRPVHAVIVPVEKERSTSNGSGL
jgi:hypothetical protein